MKRLAIAATFGLLITTGCAQMSAINPFAKDPVARAREATPVGSAFNQALYRAYLTRAEEKSDLGQRGDASYFASRAKVAADGHAVIPEDVVMDRVGSAAFEELTPAHDGLVRYLVDGGRDRAPEEAAQSQSYFDCWVKAVESDDGTEAGRCKAAFENSLSTLQVALGATPTMPGQQASAGTGARRDYKVYFGFDEWHLTAEALSTITDAIETARSEGQGEIISAGHADRSGNDAYNMKLSERRAEVVKEVMVEMGARAEAIKVESYGETRPEVETADGVAEPKNRRVEIALMP